MKLGIEIYKVVGGDIFISAKEFEEEGIFVEKVFPAFIEIIKEDNWINFAIGTHDLTFTEKLHSINEVDITKASIVLIETDIYNFQISVAQLLQERQIQYSGISIYSLMYGYNKILCADIKVEVEKAGLYCSAINSCDIIVNDLLESTLHEHQYYYLKADLKKIQNFLIEDDAKASWKTILNDYEEANNFFILFFEQD